MKDNPDFCVIYRCWIRSHNTLASPDSQRIQYTFGRTRQFVCIPENSCSTYWGFCQKYQFDPACRKSLSPFLLKLQDKNQAESLRKQAHHAISIYYGMRLHSINEDQAIKVNSTMRLGRKEPLNQDSNQTAVSVDRKRDIMSKRIDKHRKINQMLTLKRPV